MKNTQTSLRLIATALLFAMAAFVTSCNKSTSDPLSGEVSQTVNNESTQDSQQDEVDDMSTNQLSKSSPKGGRLFSTMEDGRVACAQITFSFTEGHASDSTGGTLIINFDKTPAGADQPAGCTDARGNVRKGQIAIAFTGERWFKMGSTTTITLTNYSINGVVLNGTRTLTNVTPANTPLVLTWNITSNITITWPDTKTATRQVNKTRAWDIIGGTVTVTQTAGALSAASGTTRNGVAYSVEITQGLVFKLSCIGTSKVYLPVSGTKTITFNSKTVTIDFGAGDCDATFTVTLNGKTDTFTGNNGSAD